MPDPEFAFVNQKSGKRYKVVTIDQDAGKVTLVGEAGIPFTEPYSKERFVELGYKLQQL
jgi:hypothetical protein